jgi:hypothetical protein
MPGQSLLRAERPFVRVECVEDPARDSISPWSAWSRTVAGLDANAARAFLVAEGFECPSLYWGAVHGAEPTRALWRAEPGAMGAGDRLPPPLYPIARAHAMQGEAVIHAAAIAGTHGAILLLGESGAGKSTAAHHATRAGARVLGDDGCVVARGLDGRWCVAGLPGVGAARSGLSRDVSVVPVVAACLLEQSRQDELLTCTSTDAAAACVSAGLGEVPAAHWLPRPLKARLMDTLMDLARELPVHRLRLRASPHFYELLRVQLRLDD